MFPLDRNGNPQPYVYPLQYVMETLPPPTESLRGRLIGKNLHDRTDFYQATYSTALLGTVLNRGFTHTNARLYERDERLSHIAK